MSIDAILDLTFGQLAHYAAAIQRRQWLDDLAHRRLETLKLRHLCAYIAMTIDTGKGDNPMLADAAQLSLGAGTEPAGGGPADDGHPPVPVRARVGTEPAAGGGAQAGGEARPFARVDPATLPDAPPSVRVGQRDPTAAAGPHTAGNAVPFEQLNRLLGGGGPA